MLKSSLSFKREVYLSKESYSVAIDFVPELETIFLQYFGWNYGFNALMLHEEKTKYKLGCTVVVFDNTGMYSGLN